MLVVIGNIKAGPFVVINFTELNNGQNIQIKNNSLVMKINSQGGKLCNFLSMKLFNFYHLSKSRTTIRYKPVKQAQVMNKELYVNKPVKKSKVLMC